MSRNEKPMWMSSLTEEEKAVLSRIEEEELLCDWCNEPLFARLIFDKYEKDVLKSIELFCKSCNRIYSIKSDSLGYWDEVLNTILRPKD